MQQSFFDLVKMTSFGVFVLLACCMYVFFMKDCYNDKFQIKILENIYFAAVLNALTAIIVLVSPDARQIIYSIVDTSPLNELHLSIGMRSSGLFYFGGSIMSVFHCFIFYLSLIYVSNFKHKVSILDFIFLLINISGIFISGRFGFILLLVLMLLLLCLPKKTTCINKRVILGLMAFSVAIMSILIISYYDSVKRLIDWGLEVFINYIKNGHFESHSTDVLQTMYKLPDNLIFGEGIFSQEYLGSDSGYVQLLWYFGVIGLLFYASIFSIHAFFALNQPSKILRNLYLLILALIIIGNFKDIYLFASNGVTQIYFIIMILSLFDRRVSKKYEKF